MKLISVLSALALAVLPCEADKPRMFNLTFYSIAQNRSIEYPVHENMGIGIIRTKVARKIVQRLPLTVFKYHNATLFDIKTVKDYGLNENSDPIIIHKKTSKMTLRFQERERKAKEKKQREKEKKEQKAKEKAEKKAQEKQEIAQKEQVEKEKAHKEDEKKLTGMNYSATAGEKAALRRKNNPKTATSLPLGKA